MKIDDIISRLDLLALNERLDNDDFGDDWEANVDEKMRVAVMDWLGMRLESRQLPPYRHITRVSPSAVIARRSSVYTDFTSGLNLDAAASAGVVVNSLLPAPATDAFFVGLDRPYRALHVEMLDDVNALACTLSMAMWDGTQWTSASSLENGTIVSSKALGGGGTIRWKWPNNWHPRPLHTDASSFLYWGRITLSSSVTTTAKIVRLLPIRRSRFTYPVGLYTLGLLHTEAATGSRGDYKDIAEKLYTRAGEELELALTAANEEFDLERDGVNTPTEATSTAAVMPNLHSFERG